MQPFFVNWHEALGAAACPALLAGTIIVKQQDTGIRILSHYYLYYSSDWKSYCAECCVTVPLPTRYNKCKGIRMGAYILHSMAIDRVLGVKWLVSYPS